MDTSHTLTPEQIAELRAGVRSIAATLDCSLAEAWKSMSIPDYVWAAVVSAREAAGPPKPDESPDFIDLLAADTPERDAAADARLAAIRDAVLS